MKKSLLILLSLVLSAYSNPVITVTTKPYERLVQELAGSGYSVQAFVPAGEDAHHFQPTTAQMRAIEGRALWFGTGEPLERHLRQKADFIDLKASLKTHHPWLDPIALKGQLYLAKEALIKQAPKDATLFEANYKKIVKRLDMLDLKIRALFEKKKPRAILAMHPTLDAFCDRYGIELITLEEEGKGASFSGMHASASLAQKYGIKTLLSEPGRSDAERAAKRLGLKVAFLDPYCDDVFELIETTAILLQDL